MSLTAPNSDQTVEQLNEQFGIQNSLRFVTHPSGLVQAVIETEQCKGSLFLLGGHVAEFQPVGQSPVLFLSEAANYEVGKAIRGGIPICFPWFGAKKSMVGEVDSNAPAHGLVRTELWRVLKTESDGQAVSVTLGFAIEGIEITYQVRFDESIEFSFETRNSGDTMLSYEVALHTYFSVGDINQVKIRGLEELDYLDQLTAKTVSASHQPIRFSEETDRIYQGKVDEILLEDEANHRLIKVEPFGSESTVVWNPWVEKSKRMPDFGDHEYPSMCCIETANIGPNAVQLPPQDVARAGARISIAES